MIIEWIKINFTELFASLTGLVGAYFAIKEKNLFWILSIVSNVFFVVFFILNKIYAIAILDTIYIFMSIFGLYNWIKKNKNNDDENDEEIVIRRIKRSEIIFYAVFFLIIYFVLFLFLKYFTDSQIYYLDSLVFAFGMTGTILLMKKIIENWYVWVVSDIFTISFFTFQKHYIVGGMYVFLLMASFIGLYQWTQKLKIKLQIDEKI